MAFEELVRSRSRSPYSLEIPVAEPLALQWAVIGAGSLGLPLSLFHERLEAPLVTWHCILYTASCIPLSVRMA